MLQKKEGKRSSPRHAIHFVMKASVCPLMQTDLLLSNHPRNSFILASHCLSTSTPFIHVPSNASSRVPSLTPVGDPFTAGAQYADGTTDITRTIRLKDMTSSSADHAASPSQGAPPATDERRAFTLVLKGHIALDTAVFPENTPGNLAVSTSFVVLLYAWACPSVFSVHSVLLA